MVSLTQLSEGVGWIGESVSIAYYPIYLEVITLEQVISLIQTVGFPIACAVAMFWMLHNEQKSHKEETQQLTNTITDLKISFAEAINQQKTDMVTAINNNTLVIQQLLDRMENSK